MQPPSWNDATLEQLELMVSRLAELDLEKRKNAIRFILSYFTPIEVGHMIIRLANEQMGDNKEIKKITLRLVTNNEENNNGD